MKRLKVVQAAVTLLLAGCLARAPEDPKPAEALGGFAPVEGVVVGKGGEGRMTLAGPGGSRLEVALTHKARAGEAEPMLLPLVSYDKATASRLAHDRYDDVKVGDRVVAAVLRYARNDAPMRDAEGRLVAAGVRVVKKAKGGGR
jgi:hypothetical protein